MSVETSTPRSRRAVLAAALGGLGAVIASRIATPDAARAATGDPVLVDTAVAGLATTSVSSTAVGAALAGSSLAGTGVLGTSQSAAPAWTSTTNRTGVMGLAGAIGTPGTSGGVASSTDETGVYGWANTSFNATGVWGDSWDGTGVAGSGYWGVYGLGQIGVVGDADGSGTGVYGFTGNTAAPAPASGVGVQATAGSPAFTALNVTGKAKFSRSGRIAIARGRSARRIVMPGVSASSYIIATLQTRRAGVYVHAVVPAAGSFTIYLNKIVTGATVVGFLVIN